MFQESEIINLFFSIIAAVVFISMYRKTWLPRRGLMLAGFVFMLAGFLFTVLEGILWSDAFNLLEHISYGLSGISFGTAAWLVMRLQDRVGRGEQ